MTCQIDIKSDAGGRIEVTSIDHIRNEPFRLPIQLSWHPPASTNDIDMGISYNGSTLENLGEPSGGHILFTPSTDIDTASYWVTIRTDTGEMWNFTPNEIEVGPNQAAAAFVSDNERGRSILKAIHDGKIVKVEIKAGDKIESSAIFETSNIKARNTLIFKAGSLIKTSDPSVCRPIKSLPVTFPDENGR